MSVLTRIAILFSFFGVCSIASADDWAKKMFTETSHDFRTVGRGTKQEFHFELKNVYQETYTLRRSAQAAVAPRLPSPKIRLSRTRRARS